MPKTLIVGDVHATPQEIPDCEALLKLIFDSIKNYKCDSVIFLGDQFNTHDILNSRVVDFWTKAINDLSDLIRSYFLIGNHDQLTPTIRNPHSMVSFYSAPTDICDSPRGYPELNACCMPYYVNPLEFIEAANKLKEANPTIDTLYCHQTFSGADEGKGFYSKESVEPTAIPFKRIISGHIHKPMQLGKVFYPGAPRWRNLTDAEVAVRNIFVWEQGKIPNAIPTNTHCVRIYRVEDSEEVPFKASFTAEDLIRADIRVTITGTQEYISKRILELRSKYNAKCRGVPTRQKLIKTSESEGIDKAFSKFGSYFTPPNGSEKDLLLKEVSGRLGL